MEKGKTAGIWIRVSTEDQVKWDKYHNAFQFLNIDDAGRIFVETYEEGERPEEVLLQIFNAEGIFVGTKSLKEAVSRKFKSNCLYCIYRKESKAVMEKIGICNIINIIQNFLINWIHSNLCQEKEEENVIYVEG